MIGAEIIISFLQSKGVECAFGYPGGPVLVLYEAIYKAGFNHILAGHEQGAIHAAEGYAMVTGKTGVVIATSGPGATNLVTGLADAKLDSVPLLAITGAVARADTGKDAFQEADITGVTEPVTKYNYLVMKEEDLIPSLEEAWKMTRTGRPGPVLVNIPKDILSAEIKTDAGNLRPLKRHRPARIKAETRMDLILKALSEAQKPLLLVGGGAVTSSAAPALLKELTTLLNLPCATTLMGKGAVAQNDPSYLGHIGMHGTVQANRALAECDLLLAVGSRFSDRVIGQPAAMRERIKTIIHVDIDASEIGKVLQADIEVEDDAAIFLNLLLADLKKMKEAAASMNRLWQPWHNYLKQIQTAFEETVESSIKPTEPLLASYTVRKVSDRMAGLNPVCVTDVGQHQMFAAQYFNVESPRSFLTSGGLGTMGFGLPAAIGASYAVPDRPTVLFVGDGGFQMTIEELGLLNRLNLPLLMVLLDNKTLGMVRQWQELFFDEHYSQSMLPDNPDFLKIAEAYGISGRRVRRVTELEAGIDHFLAERKPYLLHVDIETLEKVFPMIPAGQGPERIIMPDYADPAELLL